MEYLDNVKFQFYPADIEKCAPIGYVTLREFITSHIEPKQEVLDIFENIKKAAGAGDLKLKNELKKNLFYFTPCVKVKTWRKYENIIGFTGLMQIDFDGIEDASEFRDQLFELLDCVVCSYLSPSRLGFKALVRIPICKTVDEYKSYAYGLFHYLEKYRGFDQATKNPILPLYLSHDPDLKYRGNPTVWDIKGIQTDEFDMSKVDSDFEATDELDMESRYGIANHIENIVKLADKQQVGHKNVVSASLVCGGYAGYYTNIDQDSLFQFLLDKIGESPYLQKDLKGYQKTAKIMYSKGMLAPIPYVKK